ncbi:MAG: DNA translocase FtsK, partial [Deltaproteobacteria bacterium]|nr:DNA translocase FtsK [Nannocystaceae bacterium]
MGLFHRAGTYLIAGTVLCIGLIASTPLSSAHLIALARTAGRGLRSISIYLWNGAAELLRSAREDAEASAAAKAKPSRKPEAARKAETPAPSPRGKRAAIAQELTEDEEEDEFEEEEDADEQEDDELEEEEEAAEEDELEEEEEEDDDAEEEPAAASSRRRKPADAPKPKKAEEAPEIVVGVAEPAKPKKAAPPRPEELAKQTPVPVRPAASAPAAPPRRAESAIPGVIRLTAGAYELPPAALFEAASVIPTEFDRNFVLEQAQRLVAALGEFRIRGKVTKIHPGPVITRYEFKPEAGVKLSKIESLENDIAMALEALRIRILAPIPGKATVGFEVPNKHRETVYIKEILASENFGAGSKLPLALGKDITGHVTSTDLAKAPHLLVAGATGSGKSVGVNAMICSLLYTCSPEDVRMIMIDPKMLELSIYEGIPHLLLPVVTDPEKAALALRWAVQEMERRYSLLSEAQVRDIAGYNRKLPEMMTAWDTEKRQLELAAAEVARDAALHGEDGALGSKLPGVAFDAHGNPQISVGGAVDMPERPTKLPYIVVIIDEFADLMMVASKEVEQCVARIAAKARAAGIHLIVATQRPSVDVITGTIKNNFPSRIAFQVTSDVDSRTILDGKGAKQLLGMGDMLHMDRGMQAQRVHGCYVSED